LGGSSLTTMGRWSTVVRRSTIGPRLFARTLAGADEQRDAHALSDPQWEPRAAEQLLPLVYDALPEVAAQRLAQEAPGQTL
jgi:hypothetical protein